MDKKVYAIVIMLCMILVGCGNEVTCEYESIKKSDLGQKLFENRLLTSILLIRRFKLILFRIKIGFP